MVKIFQFLRLSTKFLAVFRLSVNPIETLLRNITLFGTLSRIQVSWRWSQPVFNAIHGLEPAYNVSKPLDIQCQSLYNLMSNSFY